MKLLLPFLLAALSFAQTTVPTLVDGTNFPARSTTTGSSANPYLFVISGSIYLVEQGETSGGQVGIWKCDIAGSACNQMDAAGRPSDGRAQFVAFSAASSSTIEVVYASQASPTNQIKFVTFDTSTDTWGSPSAALTLALPMGILPFDQGSSLFKKNDGTYYLYMVDDVAAVARIGYYTFSAGTWSSFTPVIADTSAALYSVTRDDSTEEVHIFFRDLTISSEFGYVKIASDNTPGTPVLLPASQNASNTDRVTAKVVGSTLYAIYNDTEGAGMTCPLPPGLYRVMELSTPTSSTSFTSTIVFSAPDCDSQTRTGWGTVAVDAGTRVNAFWTFHDSSGSPVILSIYQSVLNGGVWGAPTVFYDQVANGPMGPSLDINNPSALDAVCEADGWAMPMSLRWGTLVGYLYVNGTCSLATRKVVHRASPN